MSALSQTKEITVKTSPRFLSLLTILFIGLKLTGHITWSWLWVLSPLWLPVAVVLGFLGSVVAGAGVIFMVAAAGDTLGRRLR